ncbi:hypothetical protein [Hymenobacter cellulosilyticus]|uniref:Uncharacterized protein n=1 Tax=Hymenobacter cellulosilyticus TaxID=2932248 RepID=A0A8T9QGX7_9BACT|nr:hypothetical protein [Hymenobacter cellulosilyticus]UOQ74829.1 hypothetical protein MUN79_13725 [Hymenobacter cellulosilyticus]
MQVTLPPKPVSDAIIPRHDEPEKSSPIIPEGGLRYYSQLAHFRSWQDFAFTGVTEQDVATAQEARQAFEAMQLDSLQAHGIRIRFGNQSTYASVIRMLDWANAATPKYLVDFHHGPTTLYAFTEAYRPPNSSGLKLPEFCLCNDVLYYHPSPPSFETQMQNWFTRWQQAWHKAFSSPIWQLPIVFLLGITALNGWKMARRWHTA